MDDINIDIGLDPATYLAGADQLSGANTRLQQSMGGVVTTSAGVQKALAMITPSRAALAGMGALAVAAGKAQQELSGLNATSAVTGINTGKLASGMRQLAREMPVGNTMARQVAEQFTKMGVSAAGSEKQIGDLAKVTANLGGATGENMLQLGQGMTQLARATGNINLEPKRFEKLSDSLVRVSKTSGASASDILAFSKNIAPMAQAAGIGATGIVGISGAFARLGEDGVGASTAVNKMLTDMSRSVREGGPQMKAYAEIVGTTSDEFERMFKANPAEALNKVTESLAKAGSAGPRQLEMLGLDGVRSQRALQALSASGGLRGAIAESEAGYGSGDSAQAAEAAFSGLNDSFTELQSTSEQLAQALGAPLTKPLKLFADGLKAPLSELTKVANSKVAQNLLTVAGIGVTSALAAKAVLGPLSLLGMGRQMSKSGPVRAFLGGVSLGAEDDDEYGPGKTRRSRVGAPMLAQYEQGVLGLGMMGGANTRAMDFGIGMGERLKRRKDEYWADETGKRIERRAQIGGDAEEMEYARYDRRRQMNPIRRGLDTAKTYGMVGLNTYLGEVGRSFENAAENDPRRREGKLATPDEAREAGRRARVTYDQTGDMKKAVKEFHDYLTQAGRDAGSFGETLKGARKAAAGSVKLGGVLADDAGQLGKGLLAKGAGAAKDAAGALMESMGPMAIAGIAATAAMAAWQFGGAQLEARKQEETQYSKSDIYSRINAYREASGRAGVQSVAVTAGTGVEAEDKSKGVTYAEAKRVTKEDVRLAEGSKDKKVTDYYGDTAQVAATIASTYAKGLSAEDLEAVKLDLLRGGKELTEVQKILQAIPESALKVNDVAPAKVDPNSIRQQVQGAQTAPGGGWAGFFQGAMLQKTEGARNDVIGDILPDRLDMRPGGGMYISAMSEEGKAANDQIAKAIQDGFLAQSESYQGDYAQQERLKLMDTAVKAATDKGDYEQADYLMRKFQKNLMGEKYETKTVTSGELDQYGGFTKAFAKEDPEVFGKTLDRLFKGGVSLEEGKGLDPKLKPSYQSEILRKAGQEFAASLFDNTKPTPETKAIAASMGEPESTKKLDVAVDAWIAAGDKAGMSMDEVGTAALKASNTLNSASQAFVIAREAMAEADRVTARQNVAGPKGQAQVMGETYARNVARRDALAAGPETPEARAELKGLEGSIQEQQDSYKATLIQRLETQRSYQKQVFRSTRDHNLQMEYAEVDYQKQVDRTIEGYNVNRERSIDAFNRQRERAEEDYAISRKRQIRDFNIQMQNAEEDYLKARMRANRDFAINLARQIEDAAKTMYNPYDRIQTKATWDAKNLLVNMQEQNDAMNKQKDQLDQLRKMGLSAQAIDQLQLGKTENAQQVNNLVQDFGQDPAMVAELNRVAEERAKAAGSLYTDESNKDLQRAREDLKRGLGDMATDYKTNMDRARATLSRNLKDQADDFAKNLKRTNKDFNISLEQAAEDLSRNLGYMEDDFTTSVDRQNQAFQTAMDDMAQDVKDADLVISGSMEALNEATLRAMNGKAVNLSKLLVSNTAQVVKDVDTKVIPDLVSSLAQIGVTKGDLKASPLSSPPANNAPTTGSGSYGSSSHGGGGGYAEGGTVAGYSPHPKADNIRANLTAGEFVQPVKAVNYYGPEFMEAVRSMQLPKDVVRRYQPKHTGQEDDGPFFAEGGMVYQKMARWLHKNIPDAQITSSYRPGAITALGNVSMHAQGKALDISPSMANFNKILGSFGSSIHQLFYAPADGRTILRGKPWKMDPVTKSGHYNHVHWAMQAFTEAMSASGLGSSGGDFGMATGPSIDLDKVFKGFQNKPWVYKAVADRVKKAITRKLSTLAGGSSEAYSGKAGVGQWSDEVADVLKMLGRGQGEAGAVLRRIEMESSGNPRAINNWDSNAKAGTPSKGLMQVIDPTFRAYHSRQLPNNIWDPRANIYAGANYAIHRYGSLAAIDPRNKPTGYDQGGYMKPGEGKYANRTGKPEPVLTQDQWASISRLAAHGGLNISREQGRGITSGVSHISVTNHYTYDNRNDFGGALITVEAQDPDEMGRKLERKVVTDRVTQTRGVRRNP